MGPPGFRTRCLATCTGSQTAWGLAGSRDNVPVSMAFRCLNRVGTPGCEHFAAQWLTYRSPCQRFASDLAVSQAHDSGPV